MTALIAPPADEPVFVDRDPAAITAELVALFEERTGRPLQPAQVERLIVDVIAYRETLLRTALQLAATQNLVAFARGTALDRLGELVGAARLPAGAARTTLRFTLTAAQPRIVVVPAGTTVDSVDFTCTVATDAALVIPAGALDGDVTATAVAAGPDANGYAAGTLTQLGAPIAWVGGVGNLSVTAGGTDAEDDERFRDRVRQAPTQYSVAGSAGAYRYHALSVSGSIVDVAVTSRATGLVRICVLTADGVPSDALLGDVASALSADRVRPLTDTVQVIPPAVVAYEIVATLRPLAGVDLVGLLVAGQTAAEAYAADRAAQLGRDVVPSQIVAALSVPGVYDVVLAAPAYLPVADEAFARCTRIVLDLGAVGG